MCKYNIIAKNCIFNFQDKLIIFDMWPSTPLRDYFAPISKHCFTEAVFIKISFCNMSKFKKGDAGIMFEHQLYEISVCYSEGEFLDEI